MFVKAPHHNLPSIESNGGNHQTNGFATGFSTTC